MGKPSEPSRNHVKRARWKTRGRGPGVRGTGSRGVENMAYEKHGVWKTRGLVENTGSQCKTRGLSAKHRGTISPNNEVGILLFQIAMKINRRDARFLVIKAN